ncbi:MAG: hypothetical protein ABIS14_11170, partial [Sphingomonas sp.]
IRLIAIDTRSTIGEVGNTIGQIERHAVLVDAAVQDHRATSAEFHRGTALALELLDATRTEMQELNETSSATKELADSLITEALLLAEDADGVDTALRQVIDHLRQAD